jgi:hypothetical protein
MKGIMGMMSWNYDERRHRRGYQDWRGIIPIIWIRVWPSLIHINHTA